MMMSLRNPYQTSSYAVTFVLVAAIVGGIAGSALGGDPLTLIPSDVAGVIAFRDLDGSAKKLSRFLKGFNPNSSGIDLRMMEDWLDCEPGTWDSSQPVVFVLSQPSLDILTEAEFSETTAVLAFTPKDPEQYAAPKGSREGAVRRIEQAGRDYYVTMRDGVVFCSGKRRVMRMIRAVSPSESLAATLDDQQKALYAKSDLFVHLPMVGWRERINVLTLLAGNMMRLGVAAENDAALMESGKVVLDWFTGAVRSVVDQMQSFTLSVDFDGETFRLTHYHAFRAGGSVSEYLRQVKRSGVDLWATLPDRPFYLLTGSDWRCPAAVSVAMRFQEYSLNADAMGDRISPELRKMILDQSSACHDQTMGSYLMLTSPPDRAFPVQILGGYYMEDASEGSKQLRFVQENSTEAFAGFIGGAYAGKFERRARNDQEYYEMHFDSAKMSPGLRQQMSALYGENLHIQDAVLGRNYVVYAMSGDDEFLPNILRAQAQGQNIGKNARIREIAACLPTEPHGLVVLDLGRLLSAAPRMARLSIDPVEPGGRAASPDHAATPGENDETLSSGPLLGWACVVRPTSFSGHLAISAKDAIETARLARKMAREFPTNVQRVRIVVPPTRSDN
jgi:hypothetical protein